MLAILLLRVISIWKETEVQEDPRQVAKMNTIEEEIGQKA
jgi:hypothetical protein